MGPYINTECSAKIITVFGYFNETSHNISFSFCLFFLQDRSWKKARSCTSDHQSGFSNIENNLIGSWQLAGWWVAYVFRTIVFLLCLRSNGPGPPKAAPWLWAMTQQKCPQWHCPTVHFTSVLGPQQQMAGACWHLAFTILLPFLISCSLHVSTNVIKCRGNVKGSDMKTGMGTWSLCVCEAIRAWVWSYNTDFRLPLLAASTNRPF